MGITIVDTQGHVLTESIAPASFDRAMKRGEIAATGTPLVYRLVREHALIPVDPNTAHRRHVIAENAK